MFVIYLRKLFSTKLRIPIQRNYFYCVIISAREPYTPDSLGRHNTYIRFCLIIVNKNNRKYFWKHVVEGVSSTQQNCGGRVMPRSERLLRPRKTAGGPVEYISIFIPARWPGLASFSWSRLSLGQSIFDTPNAPSIRLVWRARARVCVYSNERRVYNASLHVGGDCRPASGKPNARRIPVAKFIRAPTVLPGTSSNGESRPSLSLSLHCETS